MKLIVLCGIISAALLLFSPVARALQVLSDDELEGISAGNFYAQAADGVIKFGADTNRFSVDGDISAQTMTDSHTTGMPGIIILSDNAQGNLSSFINVNAVNSNIQILINLNVNVNSTVGEMRQQNWIGSF